MAGYETTGNTARYWHRKQFNFLTIAQEIKARTDKWNYIKLRSFAHQTLSKLNINSTAI
jgi:hypothetical protein